MGGRVDALHQNVNTKHASICLSLFTYLPMHACTHAHTHTHTHTLTHTHLPICPSSVNNTCIGILVLKYNTSMLFLTASCSMESGFIFITGPPGVTRRRVLYVWLGMRGVTCKGPPGTRPKLCVWNALELKNPFLVPRLSFSPVFVELNGKVSHGLECLVGEINVSIDLAIATHKCSHDLQSLTLCC